MSATNSTMNLFHEHIMPVGTDIPVLIIPVAAGALVQNNFGVTGHRFATGIGLAITGAAADNDTTAIAANEVKVITSFI